MSTHSTDGDDGPETVQELKDHVQYMLYSMCCDMNANVRDMFLGQRKIKICFRPVQQPPLKGSALADIEDLIGNMNPNITVEYWKRGPRRFAELIHDFDLPNLATSDEALVQLDP